MSLFFDLADAHLRDVHQLGKRILRFTLSLANLRKSVGAHFVQHLSLEVSNARRLGPALCLPGTPTNDSLRAGR